VKYDDPFTCPDHGRSPFIGVLHLPNFEYGLRYSAECWNAQLLAWWDITYLIVRCPGVSLREIQYLRSLESIIEIPHKALLDPRNGNCILPVQTDKLPSHSLQRW